MIALAFSAGAKFDISNFDTSKFDISKTVTSISRVSRSFPTCRRFTAQA
jgi:hypothetical protein